MTNLQKIYSLLPDNITQFIIPKRLRDSFAIIDEKVNATSAGFQFAITPSTPIPEGGWEKGIYPAKESGTYTLQDGIVVDLNDGYVGLIFDGENWSEMLLPLDSQLIEKSNPIVGGFATYGVNTELANSSNPDPVLYHYVKNIPSPNYGVLEKLNIFIHSSNIVDTLDVLVLAYNGKEFAEKYHQTVNVSIGENEIDVTLPIEKGDYVGIRTEGNVFTYDNTLELQDFSAYNGVNPYIQSNFNLGFGFTINFNSISEILLNPQSGLAKERVRPNFTYDFSSRIPLGIENVGGGVYTVSAGGLIMSSSDYNDDTKFLKNNDMLLDYREYTLKSIFQIKSGNTSVILGTTGANETGTGEGGDAYAITAEFTYLTSAKSGLTIKREGVNAVISSVQLDCSVGDIIELYFIHFYDRFTARVINKTKGQTDSITLILDTTGATALDLQPIYARPKFQCKLGQIVLSELNVKILDSDKSLRTLVLGDSISSCFFAGGYGYSWQFKTFVKNNFSTVSGPGYKTSNFTNQLDSIGVLNPQYLLISLGTNDLLNSISVSVFKQNMQKIIDYCKTRQIMPYLMTVAKLSVSTTSYVNAVKDLGVKNKIKVIDISTILSSGDMNADGVHPNADGHLKIAEKLKLDAIELL